MIPRADCKMVLVVMALMLYATVTAQTMAKQVRVDSSTVCDEMVVDIGFLLDSSSSEGRDNLQIEVNFVRDFANHFNIGPDGIQVGVVTFDNDVHLQFFLNRYGDKNSLLGALSHIVYTHMDTFTDKALDYMRTTFFTAANGARAGVPKIVVVLTDGKSHNATKTALAAARLKRAGISVFAVGIGPSMNSVELHAIASNTQSVFKVPQFDQLVANMNAVRHSFCRRKNLVESVTQRPTTNLVESVTQQTTTNCGGTKPVDLVFVLDSSSSEGSANFQKELDFVANIVSHINVSPSETQIALVTFSTRVHNQFYLNNHNSQSSVLEALKHVRYLTGSTFTNAALQFVRLNTLLVDHGRRPDAQPIVIVVTDGQSTNKTKTVHQATLLKNAGAVVLAVGIGSGVNQYELHHIATDNAHVFNVQGFDYLSAIQQDVLMEACEEVRPTPTIPHNCRTNPADIVLLLDSSSSEGTSGFQQIKTFVSNFAKQFEIGPQNIQISAIRFSTLPTVAFYLNTHHTKQDVLHAIDNITFVGGTTHTELALAKARTEVFTAAHGARDDANRTVILLTDGQSTKKQLTIQEARRVKREGTAIITIGVGTNVNHNELEAVASDVQHSFAVASFDTLHTIQRELLVETCTEVEPKPTIPPECRTNPADIVLLMDSSSSEGRSGFQQIKTFVSNFAKEFEIGPHNIQISAIRFSTYPTVAFYLNTYDNKIALLSAIANITYEGGNTHTDLALALTKNEVLTAAHGARPHVNTTVILLTDGQSTNKAATQKQATLLKQTGVRVITIGVGANVQEDELHTVASDVQHSFAVASFDTLHTIRQELVVETCTEVEPKPTTPPEVQPTPTIPPECRTDPEDIVLLMDSSSSEGRSGFQQIKTFVSNFAKEFEIGPHNIQISAIRFSTYPTVAFYLNTYDNKIALLSAIANITYEGGNTHTDLALALTKNEVLTAAHGARPHVDTTVILLTDGQSTNKAATQKQATLLKQTGVRVITIGVGANVQEDELHTVASDVQHSFAVASFDTLHTIRQELVVETCTEVEPKPTTPPEVQPTPTIPPECRTDPEDIVLLMDSSSSEGRSGFQQIKTFVSNFAKEFEIGPHNIQISAIRFSTYPTVAFYLNTYDNKIALLSAIANITYEGGNTHTDLALALTKNEVLTAAHGARPHVDTTVILLTDGQSTNKAATQKQATLLKQTGVRVITIGVGANVQQDELHTVASDVQHSFAVASFDTLHTIRQELVVETCTEVEPKPTTPPEVQPTPTIPPECRTDPEDIVLLMDSSSSEGRSGFQQIKTFVSNFAKEFEIGPHNIQISAIRFSTYPTVAFYLNTYDNKIALLSAIANITYEGGNTHTDLALALTKNEVLTAAHGARPHVDTTVILLTDGQSTNKAATQKQATLLKQTGVRVITIGVGANVQQDELHTVASDIQHSFAVASFDTLHTIRQELVVETCTEVEPKPTTPPEVQPTPTIPPECRTDPADIVLLMDSSSSEGRSGFQQIKTFVSNFAKEFEISPHNIQISAIRFSTYPTVAFYLNTYDNKIALLSAIANITYEGGNTHTDLALALTKNEVLTAAHGARPHVDTTVILLTDGQSTNKAATQKQATLLKQTGVRVITIGVGANVQQDELHTVASDVQHSFAVASFDTLHTIRQELVVETCTEIEPKPTITTEVQPTPTIPPECRTDPEDIVLLMDSSSSEGRSGFQQIKTFVSNFAKEFEIGPHNIQISAIRFSTYPTVAFYLNTYDNKIALLSAIANITYEGGNTHTDLALALTKNEVLTAAHGARPHVDTTVILLTDGQSTNKAATQKQATLLKQTGVRVITIGVGANVQQDELHTVASDVQHSFAVASFDTLHTIRQELVVETCTEIEPKPTITTEVQPTPTIPPECRTNPADIVLLMDSSSSEGTSGFQQIKTFVSNFAKEFEIGPYNIQISAIRFSTYPTVAFYLNTYDNKTALLSAIGSITYDGGTTHTDLALALTKNEVLTSAHGARPHVDTTVILLTDGQSTDRAATQKQATLLKRTGVRVITIGVGANVQQDELHNVASDVQHSFAVASFDTLHTIRQELVVETCTAVSPGVAGTTTEAPLIG